MRNRSSFEFGVAIDRQPQQTHQKTHEKIVRILERRGDVIEQYVARHTAADPAEEGHDQQSHNRVAAIVRRLSGDEHSVQRVNAGGEHVDLWKVR